MTTESPQSYQRYYIAGADYIRNHALWKRATATPFAAKLTKYTLGSVLAFAMSTISFPIFYAIGLGTTWSSVLSFLVGAVPNWILNRRWAWKQTGRAPLKQTITYVLVSIAVVVVTSLVTGWADHEARHIASTGERALVVTAAYVAVTVLFFVLKFLVYEFFVFAENSRKRATT